jgi:hypothetical protein
MKRYVITLRSIAMILNTIADAQELDDRMLKGRVREIMYQSASLAKLALDIITNEVLFE